MQNLPEPKPTRRIRLATWLILTARFGSQVSLLCKSGVTLKPSWGTHGIPCRPSEDLEIDGLDLAGGRTLPEHLDEVRIGIGHEVELL